MDIPAGIKIAHSKPLRKFLPVRRQAPARRVVRNAQDPQETTMLLAWENLGETPLKRLLLYKRENTQSHVKYPIHVYLPTWMVDFDGTCNNVEKWYM